MIGEVLFHVAGKPRLAFCLDGVGNLLRLSAEGRPDTLIPYAVGIESLAVNLSHPVPWTISTDQILKRLRFLPSTLIAGTEVELVLRTSQLTQASYPFVPASEYADDDEQIEAAIQMWESLPDDDERKTLIEVAMVESGLHRIPRISSYFEGVHIKTKPSEAFEVISDGWMTCRKVYRKSVVRGG